jgi:NDP-sugar pyrophosphorylase family protein
MKAMILAAGEGRRLAPLTDRLPKPLLPVLNRPLLTHTLALLRRAGVGEAVVNTHRAAPRFAEALGDGSAWQIALTYSREERLLGTAGAVRRAERFFTAPFLVVYGDNLLDVDLQALIHEHGRAGADCTIGLYRAGDPAAVGLVETDAKGRVTRFVEKPRPEQATTDWANAGVYVLDPATLATLPPDHCLDFGRDLFPQWIQDGVRVHAYPLDGLVQDIGTPAGYLAAHRGMLCGRTPRLEAGWRADCEERVSGVWADPSAAATGAALVSPALLGPGCVVERGARIGPFAVLGAACRVAPDAIVRDAVVWRGAVIDAGARVEESVVGCEARIGARAAITGGTLVGESAVVPPDARPAAGARIRRRGGDEQ